MSNQPSYQPNGYNHLIPPVQVQYLLRHGCRFRVAQSDVSAIPSDQPPLGALNKLHSATRNVDMEASGDGTKRLSLRPEWRGNRLSFVASIQPKSNAAPTSSSSTMEQSPLTQQARPEVFEPKIVGLYRQLFRVRLELPLVRPAELIMPGSRGRREAKWLLAGALSLKA